jgi:hypothetical protein
MSVKQVMGITFALALSGSVLLAAPNRVIGAVAAISGQADQPVLQLNVVGGGTREVRTDSRTKYVEKQLVTHQWNTRFTDAKAVGAGKCVDVEMREGAESLAKVVRIQVQGDPCRAVR